MREFKRGCIQAFIQFINEETKDLPRWRNGMYSQRKRGYGDYLYHQDREMFIDNLRRTLNGELCNGFDIKKWIN